MQLSPFEPSIAAAAWRYRLVILLVVLGFVGPAVPYALSRPARYTATASLILADPRTSQIVGAREGAGAPQRYAADQLAILQSVNVARKASELAAAAQPPLNLAPREFVRNTNVTGNATDSNLVEVGFTAHIAPAAVRGANFVLDAYREVRRLGVATNASSAVAQLDRTLEAVDTALRDTAARLAQVPADQQTAAGALFLEQQKLIERRSDLLSKRDEILINSELETSSLALVSPATSAKLSSSTAKVKIITIALLLGGAVGTGLAYVLAFFRRRFTDRRQPELVLGAPSLADVPRFSAEHIKTELPVRHRPESAAAEAFRFSASSIEIHRDTEDARSFAIVSANPNDGKSTITANMALALASSGLNVLVVDADLEGQGVSSMLLDGVSPKVGLVDILQGKAGLGEATLSTAGHGASVSVLSAGRPSHAATEEVLRSQASRQLLNILFEEMERKFDIVLVDTAPLLRVAYAATFVSCAKRAAVVVNHKGSIPEFEELVRRISVLGTVPVGYVYNRAPLRPKVASTSRASRSREVNRV